jgi:hypothetical protein
MAREDDPCKHAFPTRAQCPVCSKQPDKPDKPEKLVVVYVTAGGQAYHFDPSCHALAYGQELVVERGGTPAPIVTTYEHLAKEERGPCRTCRGKRPK